MKLNLLNKEYNNIVKDRKRMEDDVKSLKSILSSQVNNIKAKQI